MKDKIRFFVSIVITLVILGVIFKNIDLAAFGALVKDINWLWFFGSLFITVPVLFVVAEKWRAVISLRCKVDFWKSLKLTFVSSSFNVLTPSKMGDLSKSWYLKKHHSIPHKIGMGSVLFERFLDFLMMCAISVIGFLILPGLIGKLASVFWIMVGILAVGLVAYLVNLKKVFFFFVKNEKLRGMAEKLYDFLDEIKKDKKLLAYIIFLTFVSWAVQIYQIYLFFFVFGVDVNPVLVMALVPVAILVGMIPITLAGMGTRDSALIFLFQSYAPAPLMLGVGILASLRYFLAALIGLPWTRKFIHKVDV